MDADTESQAHQPIGCGADCAAVDRDQCFRSQLVAVLTFFGVAWRGVAWRGVGLVPGLEIRPHLVCQPLGS